MSLSAELSESSASLPPEDPEGRSPGQEGVPCKTHSASTSTLILKPPNSVVDAPAGWSVLCNQSLQPESLDVLPECSELVSKWVFRAVPLKGTRQDPAAKDFSARQRRGLALGESPGHNHPSG